MAETVYDPGKGLSYSRGLFHYAAKGIDLNESDALDRIRHVYKALAVGTNVLYVTTDVQMEILGFGDPVSVHRAFVPGLGLVYDPDWTIQSHLDTVVVHPPVVERKRVQWYVEENGPLEDWSEFERADAVYFIQFVKDNSL